MRVTRRALSALRSSQVLASVPGTFPVQASPAHPAAPAPAWLGPQRVAVGRRGEAGYVEAVIFPESLAPASQRERNCFVFDRLGFRESWKGQSVSR